MCFISTPTLLDVGLKIFLKLYKITHNTTNHGKYNLNICMLKKITPKATEKICYIKVQLPCLNHHRSQNTTTLYSVTRPKVELRFFLLQNNFNAMVICVYVCFRWVLVLFQFSVIFLWILVDFSGTFHFINLLGLSSGTLSEYFVWSFVCNCALKITQLQLFYISQLDFILYTCNFISHNCDYFSQLLIYFLYLTSQCDLIFLIMIFKLYDPYLLFVFTPMCYFFTQRCKRVLHMPSSLYRIYLLFNNSQHGSCCRV